MEMKLPEHLAIIMDGNGRWAKARRRPRSYGHIQGARAAKKIITAAVTAGLKNLTLFTFSTENWFRPENEVQFLMKLLGRQLIRERATLMKNGVRFRVIGAVESLPTSVRQIVLETIELTANNKGMTLVFALSFGGRQQLAAATRALAERVLAGELKPSEIDEAQISNHLDSHFLPDVDLVIRTSGEKRLSNFLLWSCAYSELHFVEKSWPDFTPEDLHAALADYARTERRFGRTSAPASPIQSDSVTV
jgi:undecaprenyl diphosphate synthase